MPNFVSGTVIFGGYVAGGVAVEIVFDNGEVWNFAGSAAPLFGGSISVPIHTANFPGYQYLEGGCMLEIAAASAGLVPGGGAVLNFNGLLHQLGTIVVATVGVDVALGVGGGKWWLHSR